MGSYPKKQPCCFCGSRTTRRHVFWTEIEDIQDNGWHDVQVSVLDGVVEVQMDGTLLFQEMLMEKRNHTASQFRRPAFLHILVYGNRKYGKSTVN